MDMNDRALRDIVVGLGGTPNGFPRQDGFDIIAASEVMAILCLSNSIKELRERLGNILVGCTTIEKARHRPRPQGPRRHGGPAEGRHQAESGADPGKQPGVHPWRAVRQHRPRLQHGHRHQDGAEAGGLSSSPRPGFGADLGAEKFIDIKCRKAGLQPDAVVLVATVRALKFHGGVAVQELTRKTSTALESGFVNLERHLNNLQAPVRPAYRSGHQPLHLGHRR